MEEEATQLGAESDLNTETAPDPDESLINALTATDDDETDESGTESEPAEERHKLLVNGEEKELTLSEMKARLQKEWAAEQKFERAAQLQKEIEAQREQYTQGLQQSQQFIDMVSQQAQLWAMEGQPNWQELLENNPHEYLKQQEIFKQRQATLQAAQQQHAYLQQQQQAQQQAELQQHLAKESDRLVKELIPEWSNPDVRVKDEQELVSYLKNSGYSDQDLMNLSHSRADNIALARKAMLYDRAMSKAKALKKPQPTAANPVPTVGNKASAQGKKSIFDPNLSDAEYDRMRREQRRKAG